MTKSGQDVLTAASALEDGKNCPRSSLLQTIGTTVPVRGRRYAIRIGGSQVCRTRACVLMAGRSLAYRFFLLIE
jgi:hypothetical protein